MNVGFGPPPMWFSVPVDSGSRLVEPALTPVSADPCVPGAICPLGVEPEDFR